jgi:hypothetical protein
MRAGGKRRVFDGIDWIKSGYEGKELLSTAYGGCKWQRRMRGQEF